MRVWWAAVLCLWVAFGVHVHAGLPSNGAVSSTVLTGDYFTVDYNHTSADAKGYVILLVTNQTNGVPVNGPELQVVANTIVYFSLNATWSPNDVDSLAFGLTTTLANIPSSPGSTNTPADPLGLIPAPGSAGSCMSYSPPPTTHNFGVNTWGRGWTVVNDAQVFSQTPCVLQWQVPPYNASVNATKYYYFTSYGPSIPRQIVIVDGPATPSSTGSGTVSGTGTGSGSGTGNNTTTTTSPPTTPAPSSSASPTSSASSSSSSTGSTPSGAFPSSHVSVWAGLAAVLATLSAVAVAAAAF